MFSIRIDGQSPVHVFATVFANGAFCGKLMMRTDEFSEFQSRLLGIPWHKPTHHYDWDDDVSGLIPDSLKDEAARAPWNRRVGDDI